MSVSDVTAQDSLSEHEMPRLVQEIVDTCNGDFAMISFVTGHLMRWLAAAADRRGDVHELIHAQAAIAAGNAKDCTLDRCVLQQETA